MSNQMTGRIVAASFETGGSNFDCGLERCECPEHEAPPLPAGTYVTVRLDEDCQVGAGKVRIEMLP